MAPEGENAVKSAPEGGVPGALVDRIGFRPAVPSEREVRLGIAQPQPPPSDGAVAVGTAAEPQGSFWRDLATQLWPFGYAGRRGGAALVILALAGMLAGADQKLYFSLAAQVQFAAGGLIAFAAVTQLINLVTQLMQPATGYLADRVSRVWILRVGGLITSLGTIAVGLATTPAAILTFKSVSTVGSFGVIPPAVQPLVADYVPPEGRGKAYGFLLLLGSAGPVVAPLAIGGLAVAYGWRTAFIVVGAASLPFVLLYFLLREPVRGELDRLALGLSEEEARKPQPPVSLVESFRRAARVTTLRRLWLAQVLMATALFTNLVVPLYFAQAFHLNPLQYGVVLSAEGIASLPAIYFLAPLAGRLLNDRPGRLMVLFAGIAVVMAGTLVVLWQAPNVWVAATGAVVSAAAVLLVTPNFSPPLSALLSVVIPPRIRGFGMQTILPFSWIGGVIALVGLGSLLAHETAPRDMFPDFIPFFLAAAAVYLWAAGGVDRDIRTALAAAAAEEETRGARETGRSKLLVVRDLQVVIGGAQVLFGADFDVAEGEIVALLGTNGAGKSTLLRAVAGLEPIAGGAVFFDDADVTYTPAHARALSGVAMVPGGRAVFPGLSVRENLDLAGGDTAAMLDLFPALRDRLGTAAGDLSGGEQQMLCLAQSLAQNPRLLLVDELTLGLAPRVIEELLAALRRIRDAGTTIVLVEQSVNLALTIADRAVFMEKGEVRFTGAAADLLTRGDLVRTAFLGAARGAATLGAARPVPAEAPETVLEAAGLTVRYGGVTAVEDASITVKAGEVVGFIGPNGAGKSTLFDALSGFASPQAGTVTFAGRDVTALGADARARLGLLRSFQNVRLFPALTVRETIAVAFERHLDNRLALLNALWFPARPAERRLRRRIDRLVETLGLAAEQDKFLGELSTGTRRVVDLACLLAAEPKVLLLDEPSSGLAQAETEELGPLIGRIGKETGCAVLVVEHDLPLVRSLAQRMYAMDGGRVIAEGTPDAVLADDKVVESYLAGSEAALKRSGLL